VFLFVNFFWKHYYYGYDWNTIQGQIQETSKGSMDFLLRFYNKTLTFTSFCFKIIGNYVILYWYAISTSKNNHHCFVLEINTGDIGGFLQVQHYWGVLNLKLQTISIWNWSHHVPTTFRGEQRWMGHKGGPWYVSPRRMHFKCSGMAKGTCRAAATLNSEKIKPVA